MGICSILRTGLPHGDFAKARLQEISSPAPSPSCLCSTTATVALRTGGAGGECTAGKQWGRPTVNNHPCIRHPQRVKERVTRGREQLCSSQVDRGLLRELQRAGDI